MYNANLKNHYMNAYGIRPINPRDYDGLAETLKKRIAEMKAKRNRK